MKIILRAISEQDTENIILWRNNEKVSCNFIDQDTMTVEKHTGWLEKYIKTNRAKQFIVNCDGIDVGTTYLKDITEDEAELGIFIGEDTFRGKGVGRESILQTLEYGFKELGLKKIFLRVFEDNISAVKCYTNIGFQRMEKEEMLDTKQGLRNMLFMEIEKGNN